MITRFISDIHLTEDRPDITGLFVAFLRGEARESDALYILGDLFDYWIGDDDLPPFHMHIMQELKNVVDSGVPVYFMAGNRDFLIGEKFARQTGVVLLKDPTVVDLYGTPTLLMHGDSMCTDDESYQKFRKNIRKPWVLGFLKRLPLSWRRKIAHKLRANSKTQKPLSKEQLAAMDVAEDSVIKAFEHHQVARMIHGHTHKPDIHEHPIQLLEQQESTGLRIVLGDWFEQGSILELTEDTFILRNEPFSEDEA